jgi:signal transduction histidine kinase
VRVGAFLEAASPYRGETMLAHIEPILGRERPAFFRAASGWRAVMPGMVVGYPGTRQLDDVPSLPVVPVHSTDPASSLLERSDSVPHIPVTDDRDELVGSVSIERVVRSFYRASAEHFSANAFLLAQLSAGFLHDLANALTAVQANVMELAHTDPTVATALDATTVSVHHARRIVHTLREVARRHDEVDPPVALALPPVLQSLEGMVTPLLGPRFTLEVSVAPSTPPIEAHRWAIERVLLNLVLNARDAQPRGGSIRIAAEPVSRDGEDCVCITVADDGPGVPPELRDSIFEPGFTTRRKGTGLGLAAVAMTMAQCHGAVELDPDAVGGAVFRVYFPSTWPA